MERNQQIKLLQELDELLENVETFGWVDEEENGPVSSSDNKSPKRAREIVALLLSGLKGLTTS